MLAAALRAFAALLQYLRARRAAAFRARAAADGSAEDSFSRIAELWTAYLDKYVSPQDVAIMMALFKIARQKAGKGKRDNFVDMCGYAALAADMAEGEQA